LCVSGEYWIRFLKEDELTQPPASGWIFLYNFFASFKFALAVLFIVFSFVIRPVWVDGKSMLPTLQNNDWVIVTELKERPKRGDIIVSCLPNVFNEQLIRRVIAIEGDTIDIDFKTGIVFINGEPYNEPYINESTLTAFDVQFPLTVDEGCVFVMGDNRNFSLDSRSSDIGLIKEEYILGKARIRLFPPGNTKIY
jgi:signal peptidase I